jgi:hypothetical protein
MKIKYVYCQYCNAVSRVLQLQAVVVGLLASVVTMMLGWIPKRKFNFYHVLLLCSSSVLTAACASITLGMSIVTSHSRIAHTLTTDMCIQFMLKRCILWYRHYFVALT